MACDRGQRQVAEAATCNGISGSSSKKAFYLATVAAGTLLGGWLFRRYFFPGQPTSPPLARPTEPEGVKSLAAPERIEPTPTDRLVGQRCAQCRRPAQGKGSWYNLNGRLYCQACALGQAEKARVQLVRPATAKPGTNLKYPQTGRRTSLKPRIVQVGPVDNVAGYAVWTGQKDTGLTLAPEVKMAANGQAKINKSRWFVNYDQVSKPIAGPYESVRQAGAMAALLAHLDWTKNVEDFSEGEIRQISHLTQDYRHELEFKRHMARITQTET
jgi:hypothetical protein